MRSPWIRRTRRLLLPVALTAAVVGSVAAYQGASDGRSGQKGPVSSTVPSEEERRPAARSEFRYYLTTAEIAAIKRNIGRYEWARIAWENTRKRADDALDSTPDPASPHETYGGGSRSCETNEGWFCGLYRPGLEDGHAARDLALAYAVSGDRRYGLKAKELLLAWAREYNPPARRVAHFVAEPVGFMIKGFMAFDLAQGLFTVSEKREFRRWAAHFIARGQGNADGARDQPWSGQAPFSNSATWTRALAVYAAAAAGEPYLSRTLSWNWEHETRRRNDYGWLYLIENGMEEDGQMGEERDRRSIGYALYTWHPLALIADVAKHAGFRENLFTVETESRKSLRLAAEHYASYLTEKTRDPYPDEETTYQDYDRTLVEYRAAYELAAKLDPSSKVIRGVPRFGGMRARGDNYDGHITAFNALTGAP